MTRSPLRLQPEGGEHCACRSAFWHAPGCCRGSANDMMGEVCGGCFVNCPPIDLRDGLVGPRPLLLPIRHGYTEEAMPPADLPARLRAARHRAGLTAKQAGHLLGPSASDNAAAVRVLRLESGTRTPSMAMLDRLAEVYGCRVADFFA